MRASHFGGAPFLLSFISIVNTLYFITLDQLEGRRAFLWRIVL